MIIIFFSTATLLVPYMGVGGCAKVYSSQSEVQIIRESIEYIISKIPGADNYENCPNIPNIDGGSSDTRQVSDDGQTE